MPFLITLALRWGLPGWASKLFGWLAPALLIAGALWGTYALIHRSGEKAGAAKVERKVEQQHAARVVEARSDERAAQAVTDKIGASVARADDQTTELLRSKIEDLHHALDSTPPAPVGAAPPPAPVDQLRDPINALVAGANRAAEAADAIP